MKRTLLLVFSLLLFCIQSEAKGERFVPGHKHEMRLGWSGVPTVPLFSTINHDVSFSNNLDDLFNNYSGDKYCTGNITAEYSYVINRTVTFSVGLSYSGIFYKEYNPYGVLVGNRSEALLALMPQCRVYWFRKPVCNMYSGFSLGIALFDGELGVIPQINPVGIELGRKVYGFGEVYGFGLHYLGGAIGVGYRF